VNDRTAAALLVDAAESSLAEVADDLQLLALLHNAEPGPELLGALRRRPFAECFALRLSSPEARAALATIDAALAVMPDPVDAQTCDGLAVDFAAIYLTCARRMAPTESYWLTEDHIERQEPMFAVRRWYEHYALVARDWRQRPDDHLVLQLEFVAALLRDGRDFALRDAARFLDRHLLVWSRDFFAAVAARAETGFYAGLAQLTQAHLDATRDLLQVASGEVRAACPAARPAVEVPAAQAAPYVPGVEPGW
jgi:TorA maturation chaperone TorD